MPYKSDAQRKAVHANKGISKNFIKALDELKTDKKYSKGAEHLSNRLSGSNIYDKDGTTISPFFIMNNQKLKFIDNSGNVKTGKQVLKLNDEYVKTDPDYLPPNEARKLSVKELIKRVENPKSKKFHKDFWKKWKLAK